MGGEHGSCTSCGADLVAGARFCAFCAAPVADAQPSGKTEPALPREGRKVVTALFADVVGSTALGDALDPEDFSEVIGEAVRRMVSSVEDYGGRIREMAGDGVLALFGTPVAHEDDPERAALAGLSIVEAIEQQASEMIAEWGVESFRVRVGIETGLVVLGVFGGGGALQFDAMGDTMNTAARLQSHAEPGGVLVGPVTHRALEPLFEWGDPRTLELKGKAEPVRATPLLRRSPAPRAERVSAGVQAPLVGRRRELGEIATAIERLGAGTGGAVVVLGEAGMGKTRLLAEARALANSSIPAPELLWLEGRCVSYGEAQPYLPFQGLLRELLELPAAAAPGELTAAFRERTGEVLGPDRARELLPFLGTIIGLAPEPSERERLSAMPAEALHERVLGALLAVLDRVARRQPLALALEDVQWADPSSLRLAEGLLSAAAEIKLLVLIAMRPERSRPSAGLFDHARGELGERARLIELDALPPDSDRRLLAALVGEGTLPAKVTDELLERAGGNPFFMEELVRALADTGSLVRTAGGWRFESEAAVEVPDTIEKLIVSRVDRLDPVAHEVLAAAAVLGPAFEPRLLGAVCGEGTAVEAALTRLEHLDLLREQPAPRPQYAFRHTMIQEAVYRSLLKRRRRELHRRAAAALEGPSGEVPEERLGELARHHRFGGEPRRALATHRAAGDAARRIYAIDETLEHYSAALEIAEELGVDEADEDLYPLRFGRGWIFTFTGRIEEGAREFEAAVELARRAGDRKGQVDALNHAAIAHKMRDHRTAVELHERALSIATESGDAAAEVRTLNHLALIHTNELQLDRALGLSERALGIARRHDDHELVARALDSVKLAALHLGQLERLEMAASEQARVQLGRGELEYAQWPMLEGAFVPLARADWAAAHAALSEALEINRRVGDATSEPIFLHALAWLHRSRGEYDRALSYGANAVGLSAEREVPYWQSWVAATHGSTLLELCAYEEAAPLLQHGADAAASVGNLNQGIRCAGELAWALFLLDDRNGARAAAERAEGWMRGVSCPPGGAFLLGAHGYIGVAQVWLAGGEPDRAESLIAPIHAAASSSGWKEFAASTGIVLGRCLARHGNGGGQDAVEAALEVAREAELPMLEHEAHAALAEELRASGDAAGAEHHAAKALRIAEHLGEAIADEEMRIRFLNRASREGIEATQ